MKNYYIKQLHKTFTGKVVDVTYVGPYMDNQDFALEMQRAHDMKRQKPSESQITQWQWICRTDTDEVLIRSIGY